MNKPRVVAIVQARLGSSRLPGKVLTDVAGRPMLERVVERLRAARMLDEILVATTDQPSDRTLVAFCQSRAWPVIAGSEHDVLDRYRRAAKQYRADVVVRITADCPLVDSDVVDAVVDKLLSDPELDYACNFFPRRTFPRGLDVEALWATTLERVAELASSPRHREHVTLYIYEHAAIFRIGSVAAQVESGQWRWTVDYPEDLEMVRAVYQHFGNERFSWVECLREFERHAEWRSLNQHLQQRAA